jgi:cytochrome c peroxidase
MLKQASGILFIVSGFLLFAGCHSKSNEVKNNFTSLLPAIITDSYYLSSDNPFTKEKAELGRYLFYDRRLSVNNTKACASCHAQEFSFTDSYRRSIGAFGDLHQRNAKPLINLVLEEYLTAADSSLHFPEQQIKNPMFNEHPVELGWKGNEEKILSRIKSDPLYKSLFLKAFPEDKGPVTTQQVQYSITSFLKTILSFSSSYDNYKYKKIRTALSSSQISGMNLFFSDSLKCGSCHGGFNFNTPAGKDNYSNTGLYNIGDNGSYPGYDRGLIEKTDNPADMGRYKVPVLRNLAFTAPYFHDGSAETLEEVLAVYENGGRKIDTGAYRGDGRKNPYKSPLIQGFKLNSQERKNIINFLFSLTDSSILKNPAYANPFTQDETKNNFLP